MRFGIIGELSNYYEEPDLFIFVEYPTIETLAAYLFKNGKRKTLVPIDETKDKKKDEQENLKDEKRDEVGSIKDLLKEEILKGLENKTLNFDQVIDAYEKSGGELKIKIKKVLLDNHKKMEVIVCGNGEPVIFYAAV